MFPFASLVYKENVYFGGYPKKEWFSILVNNGTKIFIDLTNFTEKQYYNLYDYHDEIKNSYPSLEYYCFPIDDNQIPVDISRFKDFVFFLCEKIHNLSNHDKMYIHCKGGHGRSGMLTACILCYLLNISPEKALYITTFAHSQRQYLKNKWKNVRCPQTFCQRKFVIDVFRPITITPTLYFDKIYKNISDFFVLTHMRPIYSQSHILSDVLFHLRKIHNRHQFYSNRQQFY